ncbi:RdgB/HAM1 family non-canonical purine NTP pyrophosphatase [Haloferula sp. BvORR071]|uniref:RdgB/HAM1 family non-canonical purine NTP pyrophosphatase n=1 Tax=Haloferula sp. BvORR071 TaxID=1396141 RepID=UPI000553835D|nr:RdgB/HAM1 family non-canonical purine NTP pyrophosphatase [Haloferula sp. BvORR071]
MPPELPVLIVATRNAHKTQEIREMIGDRYKVLDVNDFPALPAIDETGTTFLENATLKAAGISREVTGLILSDDSGLEVDALGGAPGVWSSSYGGEEGNHPKNNARLMAEMAGKTDRAARFRCTMVLAQGGQVLAYFSGTVEGRILEAPYGAGGFGYDPLFAPEGHTQSFAELGPEVKNALSHRGRALAKVIAWLEARD